MKDRMVRQRDINTKSKFVHTQLHFAMLQPGFPPPNASNSKQFKVLQEQGMPLKPNNHA